MTGFFLALKAELYVIVRCQSSKLIVLLPSLIVAGQLSLLKISNLSREAQSSILGQQSNSNEAVNAYGFFVDGLSTGLTLIFLTMVAYSAFSFANDRDTGVVRHLIIRSVNRPSLLMAKLFSFHLLALFSILMLLAISIFFSSLYWDFGPVIEDGYELITVAEIKDEIYLGLKLALIPLPATLAFGLLISVCVQSSTQAITTALGITLGLDILKGMFGNFAHYLYLYYQPSIIDQSYLSDAARLVRGYSDVLINERLLQLNTLVPIPEMLFFIALAILIVKRRDL